MYDLPRTERVTLRIFDVTGRLVRTLTDRALRQPGRHAVAWDGTNGAGNEVASGMYYYRLDAGELSQTRSMTLLR